MLRRPVGGGGAAQAVRHQQYRSIGRAHGGVQRGHPVGAAGRQPVGLLHPLPGRMGVLPAVLPVFGARVLPAGDDQHVVALKNREVMTCLYTGRPWRAAGRQSKNHCHSMPKAAGAPSAVRRRQADLATGGLRPAVQQAPPAALQAIAASLPGQLGVAGGVHPFGDHLAASGMRDVHRARQGVARRRVRQGRDAAGVRVA